MVRSAYNKNEESICLSICAFAGVSKSWEPHEKLPACSMRVLLTRFLDITTPPSRQLLTLLANFCGKKEDACRMKFLANVSF